MSVVVFLGPTLRAREARWLLDADYRPPVSAGDVLALFAPEKKKPTAIAIIDGFFEQVASVWHKEILFALSEGVAVYGSSSMGALRAAELHAFGMKGVGRVFEGYRDGALEDDDEVALVHGSGPPYAPMSEPMVNLREGLCELARRGVLRDGSRDLLIAASKARFYADRSWDAVFADARALGLDARERTALAVFVVHERPNVKRDDAVRLLRAIADGAATDARLGPTCRFEPTLAWERLRARVEGASRAGRGAS